MAVGYHSNPFLPVWCSEEGKKSCPKPSLCLPVFSQPYAPFSTGSHYFPTRGLPAPTMHEACSPPFLVVLPIVVLAVRPHPSPYYLNPAHSPGPSKTPHTVRTGQSLPHIFLFLFRSLGNISTTYLLSLKHAQDASYEENVFSK